MTTEAMKMITVQVNVASGVRAATIYDFVTLHSGGNRRVAAAQGAGATGVDVAGVLMEAVDASTDGLKPAVMAVMDGSIAEVKLGEAVATVGAALRAAGSGDTAGRAYLANATGDIIVAKALATGAIGDVIPVLLSGYGGVSA